MVLALVFASPACLVKGMDSDVSGGCKIKITVFLCIIFLKEPRSIVSLLVLCEQICGSATWNYLPNRESGTTPITSSSCVSKLEREGSTHAVDVWCCLIRGLRHWMLEWPAAWAEEDPRWSGFFSTFLCPPLSPKPGQLPFQPARFWGTILRCPILSHSQDRKSSYIFLTPQRSCKPKAPNWKESKSLPLALGNAHKHSLNALSLLHLKRMRCFMASLRYLIHPHASPTLFNFYCKKGVGMHAKYLSFDV